MGAEDRRRRLPLSQAYHVVGPNLQYSSSRNERAGRLLCKQQMANTAQYGTTSMLPTPCTDFVVFPAGHTRYASIQGANSAVAVERDSPTQAQIYASSDPGSHHRYKHQKADVCLSSSLIKLVIFSHALQALRNEPISTHYYPI